MQVRAKVLIGPGTSELAIKVTFQEGLAFAQSQRKRMGVRSSGHGARPPGFSPRTACLSHVTFGKHRNRSVPLVSRAVKWR